MKIAHLLPYSAKFPLAKHNGRYEWALRLARIQAANGHQVTVYAAPGSSDDSDIVWQSHDHKLDDKTKNNTTLIKTAFQNNHDIYHSHYDSLHYLLADRIDKPVVVTQHWFPDQKIADAAKHNTSLNVYAVPPTVHMLQEDKKLGIQSLGAIHHGIDLNIFSPTKGIVGDRLIFVGRISSHKGVLEAVRITIKANQKLDIVGKLNDADLSYWRQVEPLVDNKQIRYLGPKSQTEVARLLSEARAFIFPSKAKEAFGQVTIESQACGTPVIVGDVGASAELVDGGKSGFIVKSMSEYVDAIKKIDQIDRGYCRQFAEQFDINIMTDKYYELYRQLISK
jgi:glycosyltransferase involved in cell wall biosynthesis